MGGVVLCLKEYTKLFAKGINQYWRYGRKRCNAYSKSHKYIARDFLTKSQQLNFQFTQMLPRSNIVSSEKV